MINQLSDPDYYYHVAYSRYMLTEGVPHTLPQVKGLGWDVLFTDKEFLFHVLTTSSYYVFGETGIRAVPYVLAALSSLILYFQALWLVGRRLAWVPLLLIALDPYFLRRFVMVRPQTLAIFFFILIAIGLLSRRKFLVLSACALFALSYHAIQVPLILIAAGFLSLERDDKQKLHCLLGGMFGLVIGVLANPYFPGNITIVSQIFSIVHQTQTATDVVYGAELYPMKTNEFLSFSLLSGFAMLVGAYLIGTVSSAHLREDREDISDTKMFLFTTLAFFGLTMVTPRGLEYMVPSAVFLITLCFKIQMDSLKLLIPLIGVAAIQFFLVKDIYGYITRNVPLKRDTMAEIFATVAPTDKGHVLNCNWSNTPFIFYHRPNMSFVDILDPSFLLLHHRNLHDARADFLKQRAGDPYFVARHIFKAQYILCDSEKANLVLDRHPRMRRLYPIEPLDLATTNFAFFKIENSDTNYFIKKFQYHTPDTNESVYNPLATRSWTPLEPQRQVARDPAAPKIPTDYSDYLRELPKVDLRPGSAGKAQAAANQKLTLNCIFTRPDPAELKTYLGAELIGLGGGPNIRVWINDLLLFQSRGEPAYPQMIETLVPLPKPLTAKDQITAMVCPGVTAKYFGVAISLWTRQAVDELCQAKGSPDTLAEAEKSPALFKSSPPATCLGSLAAKKL